MRGLEPDALARWCGGTWEGSAPTVVNSVIVDSRLAAPGALFVALPGTRCDGHAFVAEAFRRGAAGAVVRPEHPAGGGPLLRVAEPLKALQAMAAGYRRAHSARIIGVTGSSGKTTVKEMIADVLAAALPTARTHGNWNNHIGLPLSLLNMPPTAQAGVFEAGVNHPGEMEELCQIMAPDWGVITNVGPVHLEFFKTEAAIAHAKAQLLRALPSNGVAVLRADAPWYETLRTAAPCRVVSVAFASEHAGALPDFYARMKADGIAVFGERASEREWCVRPPLPGAHNIANMLLAAAVGRVWGLEWEMIISALERYQPPPMRWESSVWREVVLINDAYNANPMSVAAVLQTYAKLPGARKWLVLGSMLELGDAAAAMHQEVGRQVAAGKWQGLVTVGEQAEMIAAGAAAGGMPPERIFRCAVTEEAAIVLLRSLQAGDMVLLKGSRGIGLENVLRVLNRHDVKGSTRMTEELNCQGAKNAKKKTDEE
jgi:UDP-N-acetylmuramoyl-tripeptide--D-alanyl-D-alanine ligase